MSDSEELERDRRRRLAALERKLGHRFTDRCLLELALTHSSLRDPWTESNERLEYLGDAVLELAVSEHLFLEHPDAPEGELTRLRSLTVSRQALARVGRELAIEEHLRVGKGLRREGPLPASLIADGVEALLGAIYLDAGFETARDRVLDWFGGLLRSLRRRETDRNFKAALQQWAQRRFGTTPRYRLLAEEGPDHAKRFVVEAVIGERTFPAAEGTSKKEAEQGAAKEALHRLRSEDARNDTGPEDVAGSP